MAHKHENPGNNVANIVLIIVFFIGITAPLVGSLLGLEMDGELDENRTKASIPSLALTHKALTGYPEKFDAYYKDHFGYRSTLVQLHHRILLNFFKTPPRNSILIGDDHWVFLSVGPRRDLTPLTHQQMERMRQTLEEYKKWVEGRGARFAFIVVPNKHAIYPEHLPRKMPYDEPGSRLSQFTQYLEKTNSPLEIIDTRYALKKAKNQERLYYKMDDHWSGAGELVAFQEYMTYFADWFPVFNDFELPELTSNVGTAEHYMTKTQIYPGAFVETAKHYALENSQATNVKVINGRTPHTREVTAERNNSGLPGLVMIHDSFFASSRLISVLFREQFRRFHSLQYRQDGDMQPIISQMQDMIVDDKPELVILEITERNIHMIGQWPQLSSQKGIADDGKD